jgi:hypothetical protein
MQTSQDALSMGDELLGRWFARVKIPQEALFNGHDPSNGCPTLAQRYRVALERERVRGL